MTRLFTLSSVVAALALAACTPDGNVSIAHVVEGPTPESAPDLAADLVIEAGPAEIEPALPSVGEPGSILAREAIPHHEARFHDYFQEARILAEQGDVGAAIDAYRLALFDAPESAATWYELGQAYVSVGRKSRGVECISEAAAREPSHVDAARFLARHYLGRGEPDLARRHVRTLSRHARDDYRTPYLQSRLFLATDAWEEAITAGRRAVALNPEFVYAYNNVGFASLQLGRSHTAIQYLEAATELTPVEPYMLNNLGVAYEREDRHGDALAAFARAATMDPTYVKAVANRDRMQTIVDRQTADEVARILAARAGETAEDTDPVAELVPTP